MDLTDDAVSGSPEQSPDFKSRGRADRWVVIVEEAFLPADSGGRTETLAFLRACLSTGIACYVLVPGVNEAQRSEYSEALPGAIVQFLPRIERWHAHLSRRPYVIASRPFPPTVADAVRSNVTRWGATAIISSTFRVAHIGIALARALRLPLIVRPHNLESEFFRSLAQAASGPRRLAYRVEAGKLRRFESVVHTSKYVSAFADISEEEADRRRLASTRPVHFLPPFLPAGISDVPARRGRDDIVLFLGAMDNANNVEGLRWFLHEVWGMVLDNRPEATLRVAGRRPSPHVLREIAVAPRTLGMTDLPDISPAFESAGVFINPIRRGAGVNIKVIETTGRGVPLVSTSIGLRGLGLVPEVHALVADDPHEFAVAVSRLLADRQLGERLAAAALAHILLLLDHNRLISAMLKMIAASDGDEVTSEEV